MKFYEYSYFLINMFIDTSEIEFVKWIVFLLFPGKRDELVSPSSRLMVGQPFIGGTGIFSLLQKLSISWNICG